MPELLNDQPKQSHAENHIEQIEAASEDHCWRTGTLQIRKEHHKADLRPKNSLWEVSPARVRPLPCLRKLKEGLQQGLARSFVGNHEVHWHQLIQIIKRFYVKATTAVLFNSSIGDWFQTTVGVRQGWLFSLTFFNTFPEMILVDSLRDYEGTVRIGGTTITSLRYADDIDGLAGDEEGASTQPAQSTAYRSVQRRKWFWPTTTAALTKRSK